MSPLLFLICSKEMPLGCEVMSANLRKSHGNRPANGKPQAEPCGVFARPLDAQDVLAAMQDDAGKESSSAGPGKRGQPKRIVMPRLRGA
ncbi:MAG: hypothetical protein ACRCYS_10470, partial [Beijerinckiaceae bacterium]